MPFIKTCLTHTCLKKRQTKYNDADVDDEKIH